MTLIKFNSECSSCIVEEHKRLYHICRVKWQTIDNKPPSHAHSFLLSLLPPLPLTLPLSRLHSCFFSGCNANKQSFRQRCSSYPPTHRRILLQTELCVFGGIDVMADAQQPGVASSIKGLYA